jgi:hypothetical protein
LIPPKQRRSTIVSNKQFWILVVEAFVYLDGVLAQIVFLAHLIAIEAIVQQLNTIEIVNNVQKNGLFVVSGQTTCWFFFVARGEKCQATLLFFVFRPTRPPSPLHKNLQNN